VYDIEMFHKVKKTSKIVTVLLWVNVAFAVMTLMLSVLTEVVGGFGDPQQQGIALIGLGGVMMLNGLMYFVTAVFFLIWMNRAHKSAQGLGETFFEHTSASAVWWWFVPIASLWKPMQVMKEIYAASGPLDDLQGDNMISTWWGLWIAMNFTAGCQGYGGEASEVGSVFLVFGLIAVGFEIAAAYYAVKVVETITEQQHDAWTGEKTVEVFS
jgi:hypothetical protein